MHRYPFSPPDLRECVRMCAECADLCLRAASAALRRQEALASFDHQTMFQDCADICATTARFIGRDSPHHIHVCAECAEICLVCAEVCEGLADADDLINQCAVTCRRCAEMCDHVACAGV